MKYIWGHSTSRPDIFSLFLPSRQKISIFQNLHSRSVLFCNFVIVESRYSVLECCHQYGLWCSQFPICSPHSLTYGQKKTWISHVLVNMSVTCPYTSTKLKYDPEDENIDPQRKLKQGQIWIQFCDDHKANCQEIHKTCALKLKPLQGPTRSSSSYASIWTCHLHFTYSSEIFCRKQTYFSYLQHVSGI